MFWCFSRAASQRLPVWKGCLKVSRRLRVWVWLCDRVCRPVLCGRVWPSRCVHAASSVRLSLAYISVCVCSSAASGATEGRTMRRSSDGRTKAPACASSCKSDLKLSCDERLKPRVWWRLLCASGFNCSSNTNKNHIHGLCFISEQQITINPQLKIDPN